MAAVESTYMLHGGFVEIASETIMQTWIDKVVDYRRYPIIDGRYEGLREHLERKAGEALPKCELAEDCTIEAKLRGSQYGTVYDTQLAIGCALMRAVNPRDPEAAEKRCREHHRAAALQFGSYVTETVKGLEKAEKAHQRTGTALQSRVNSL